MLTRLDISFVNGERTSVQGMDSLEIGEQAVVVMFNNEVAQTKVVRAYPLHNILEYVFTYREEDGEAGHAC